MEKREGRARKTDEVIVGWKGVWDGPSENFSVVGGNFTALLGIQKQFGGCG
jgi:hypothetical protein